MSTHKHLREKAELALGIIDSLYFNSPDLDVEDTWNIRCDLRDALREAGSDPEWLALFTDNASEPVATKGANS